MTAFTTASTRFYWSTNITVLMRFPFKDLIPSGQRITRAELTIAPVYIAGVPEISIRRIIAEWGNGVCQQVPDGPSAEA